MSKRSRTVLPNKTHSQRIAPHRFAVLPITAAALLVGAGCGTMTTSDPPGARTIAVGITGEDTAAAGFPFKASPADGELVLVDGWSLSFKRWLTVVGNVRLNQPGKDPAQQQLVGELVAQQAGPFVVDLVRQTVTPLFKFTQATGGSALDTQTRYAFSFDLLPATSAAQKIGLDAAADAAFAEMTQKGWSNYVEVVATHAPYDAVRDGNAAFMNYPTTVNFKLGWGGTTSYLNCSNPDNGTDEVSNRGVAPKQDGEQMANIHMHLDHPFWNKLNTENPPMRFDAIAARAPGTGSTRSVTMTDLSSSLVTKLTDASGKDVPDRAVLPQGYQRVAGALSYDANGTSGVDTLDKFIAFSSQAMAHLNGEGLCYVQRK